MHFEGDVPATTHIEQPARVEGVPETRESVRSFAAAHGLSGERQTELAVAVSEAVTNAVRHAYPKDQPGDVVVDAAADSDRIVVRVEDHGCGIEGPSCDADTPSLGQGLRLIDNLADHAEASPGPDGRGTAVSMTFRLDEPRDAGEASLQDGPERT